ncbi:unnamed protein product [Angiostrongylus costaricensis]|uniref:Profilin n=1 Tax=Angiostrongylus costaricensis TaxID=334426 RepID=A0A0R3P9Q8_ANGCS|nr:unnamed protein product [Angiostrongylus costaricensis]
MSAWLVYLKTMMEMAPAIKRAAVISTDGEVWASSQGDNGFRVNNDELIKFASLFNDIENVSSHGADLEAVHYVVPKVENNLMFGKRPNGGFFASKAQLVILIAVFDGENQVVDDVRKVVERMAQNLIDVGF